MATNFNIEKFDGRIDFNLWQVKMKALLVQQGLSKALDEASLPEGGKKEIVEKALSAIQLCLSNEVLRKVDKEDTASKLWLKLENLYGSGHVENCRSRSCSVAYKGLNQTVLAIVLQVASIALIGIVAAANQDAILSTARFALVLLAVILYALSIIYEE